MSIKNIVNNSLGDVRPYIEVGGKNSTHFLPNMNMSFFGDEFYINLNRKDKSVQGDCATTADSKTKLSCGDDTDVFYIDKSGRFKWDIEFTEKPKSNIITWELKHSSALTFYYQPALTDQEISQGKKRSDEVVGSYAVYCGKKNKHYKTGKICHIYRPLCIDTKGVKEYAELLIDKNSLTITIPQKYIDTCAYPMTLDPTIGYTSAPASWDSATSGFLVCSFYDEVADESGTAQTMYMYARRTTSEQTTSIGYYDDNVDHTPNAVVSYGSITVTSATGAWYSTSVTGDITSGNYYYPAFLSGDRIEPAYDTGGNQDWGYYNAGGSFVTDPNLTRVNVIPGIYLEYGTSATGNTYYYQQQM